MASYYKSTSTSLFYHLHIEFVRTNTATANQQEEDCATLCLSCYETTIYPLPKNSRSISAAGIDFGNTECIFLPKLKLAEEHVIATTRLLMLIIKVAEYQNAER
jgi:hypothetical protein